MANPEQKLTLEECIKAIDGYHDFPECGGTASVEINGNGWILSACEGSQCWWDGAPTYRELMDSEFSAVLVTDEEDIEDEDETVREDDIEPAFILAAHAVCSEEEEKYDATMLNRRIDTILENVDGMRVYRDYPRDFANEFSLVIDNDRDEEPLTREQLETILENWLNDETHYGDLLSEFDTYSP